MKRNETVQVGKSSPTGELEPQREFTLVSVLCEEMETNEIDVPESSNVEKEMYTCPQCQKQYKHITSLQRHMRLHDKKKRMRCEICVNKFFSTKNKYKRHMLSHTGVKLHECRICSRGFGQLSHLKIHQYMHQEEKIFKCSKCPGDRYFRSPNLLSDHLITHQKEKRHQCSHCHKKFHRSCDLRGHERVHTKPYDCPFCKKRFSRVGYLQKHVRVHIDQHQHPFECDICDQGFTREIDLKQHMKNCARLMEKRRLKCPQCPKRYVAIRGLSRHMKIHNKETTN